MRLSARLGLVGSLLFVAFVAACGGGDGTTVSGEDGGSDATGGDASTDGGTGKDSTPPPDDATVPPAELDASLDIGFPDGFTVPDSGSGGDSSVSVDGGCSPPGITCTGAVANTCANGVLTTTNCALQGKICADGFGCVTCAPGTGSCNGSTGTLCKSDGSGFVQNDCDPLMGLSCNAGVCTGACANVGQSYIGCDYYAVTMSNPALNQAVFTASVSISNTGPSTASVNIVGPAAFNQTYSVASGAIQEVTLPWVSALSTSFATVRSNGGAYRVRSTQPVTVYQFNARDYTKSATFSYTNDASILLPVNAMTGNYYVATMPDWNFSGSSHYPGLVTIIGTEANTSVTFTPTGAVQSGSGINATTAATITLNGGDVMQIESALNGPSAGTYGADLSGATVVASAPVEVFGGSACSNVPANVPACDHLEEVMFPLETLRTDVLVVPPNMSGSTPKHFVRIVGTAAGTTLTYDPVVPGAPATLTAGQVGLFETSLAFRVTSNANHPILVATYMESSNNFGGGVLNGDPAMSLAVASAQYRTSYAFTAPNNYQVNWTTVIAPTAGTVTIDGVAVGGWTNIGASGYRFAYYQICNGNCGNFASNHSAAGSLPFGIQVYGYGSYTSYMYPGGLDLKR